MTEILDYWPIAKFSPRPSQEEALLWLQDNLDKKYLILDAPVGSGKSLIGLTLSRYLSEGQGDSYILTPQIVLQQQYENETLDDSNTLFSMYGKGNYTCGKFKTTCDIGSILKKCGQGCSYKLALNKSLESSNVIMNYALALLMFGFTPFYPRRKLMICDEAHNLESMLVNFNLLTITKSRADKYQMKLPRFENIEDGYNWLVTEYKKRVDDEFDDLTDEIEDIKEKPDPTPADLQKFKQYEKLLAHIHSIHEFIENHKNDYMFTYVMISEYEKLEFKPLYGKENFNRMLKDKADQFLIMSGTILNRTQYCSDLGIPEEETAFLSLDSEFDKDNRPVIYYPAMKMNYKWNSDENADKRNKLLNNISNILNLHDGEKGIIHTGNFKIAEWLVENLKTNTKFRIYHHNPNSGNNRNSVIDMFVRDTKPSLLISPSITEGLDLKHDKGRFAIIAKVPYPFLGDKWIKRRLELSQEWYNIETARDIIQGCGRVVRSGDDYGTTYIIDESWNYFYYQNRELFPKWWQRGFNKL